MALVISDGAVGNEIQVAGQQSLDPKIAKRAQDVKRTVPAVGSSGRAVTVGPLQPFEASPK